MTDENNEALPPLDCAEFAAILPDLDRAGAPESERRDAALAHAESCSQCAALLTASESLDFGLHSLARRDALIGAPPGMEAGLRQYFRRERETAARRGTQRLASILAIAAAALLAVGLTLHYRETRAPGGPAMNNNASTPTFQPAAGSGISPADSQQSAASAEAAGDADDTSSSPGTEYASAFVAVPYAEDSAELQNGSVVRVMLPRAALASLGMSAAYSGTAERIPADVVLSEDGTPQAIRLVSQDAATQDF